MIDTNIDNSNLDSIQEVTLGPSETNHKKVNFKEDVISNPYENDGFWNDCHNEDKDNDKNENKEHKLEKTDKHLFSNPISAKDSLNNISNLFSNSLQETSPKNNHNYTHQNNNKKISCLKCFKKEEKKKAFNNSFTNDTSTNTYVLFIIT